MFFVWGGGVTLTNGSFTDHQCLLDHFLWFGQMPLTSYFTAGKR